MKKTALTYDLLSRFERLVNPETLTDSQVEKVEHYAYCAELVAGQNENITPWGWFCHLVMEYLEIDLESLESQAELSDPRLTNEQNEELSKAYAVLSRPATKSILNGASYTEFVTRVLDDIASGIASW